MAAPKIPPGGTLLDTFSRRFSDVPIDAEKNNAISTTEFLEAAEALTTMFDVLGSVAFKPVKSDMLGNIEKIKARQTAFPAESKTLQELCLHEFKTASAKDRKAIDALTWLVRGLDFTRTALGENVAKRHEELADSFRNAYGITLKPHHSMFVKPVFSAAMSACPYRKEFYTKFGSDEEKVYSELCLYLAALEKIVGILKEFLVSKELQ